MNIIADLPDVDQLFSTGLNSMLNGSRGEGGGGVSSECRRHEALLGESFKPPDALSAVL